MPRSERSTHKAAPTRRRRSEILFPNPKLGQRIKLAREREGLTQAQVAKKLGVSRGAIGQWETDRGAPATGRLGTLAEYLGISLDWLLAGPPQAAGSEATGAAMVEDVQLVEEARQLGVDLQLVVAEARQRRWLHDNREALADAHTFLARRGLWSDGKRQL
jgi:transcriptional regulator with XRE-family HTH domain